MKSLKIKPSGLLFIMLLSLVITPLFSVNMNDAIYPFAVLFTFSAILSSGSKRSNALLMAVTREIWEADIVNNLYKNNQFALRAFNADLYVLAGKVVHIPVAGAASTVTKNATNFPVSALKRTDTDINYNLDTFYTTPRQIEKIETYELEYDKRQSIIGEDTLAISDAAMDALVYNWLPLVGNTVLTTGNPRSATISGGTANVKTFSKAEFMSVKRLMDAANVSSNGRVALLTAEHYNDFFASLSDPEKVDVGRVADLANGLIGKYLGFEIYMRSTVGRYRGANGAYVKVDEQDAAFAASDKTSDRAASLFYQEIAVERAKGQVEMFDEPVRADYYGAVISFILRLGGRIRRTAGVWAVVEDLA